MVGWIGEGVVVGDLRVGWWVGLRLDYGFLLWFFTAWFVGLLSWLVGW